jgi:hypothetical protein
MKSEKEGFRIALKSTTKPYKKFLFQKELDYLLLAYLIICHRLGHCVDAWVGSTHRHHRWHQCGHHSYNNKKS